MSIYVIDASVAIKWLFEEIHQKEARCYLESPIERIAPDIIFLEIASATSKKENVGTIQSGSGIECVRLLRATESIKLFPFFTLLEHAYKLATELNHAVYDCMYLALANEKKATLVTADKKFYNRIIFSIYRNRIVWVEDSPKFL